MGYHQAGFEVLGVDINPQPNYPFEFHQADAMTYPLEGFDAIHASPPCQAYSLTERLNENQHPDLLAATRKRLRATGLPWVIENVKGAPLRDPQVLEGQMFGLNLHRPRLFETSWGFEAPHLRPPPPCQVKMGREAGPGEAIQVVGHFSGVEEARVAMETPWMNRDEMAQAIPPAYTRFIGEALLSVVSEQKRWNRSCPTCEGEGRVYQEIWAGDQRGEEDAGACPDCQLEVAA
jgi:DNA (cytosine-5)-methyltransferase 1